MPSRTIIKPSNYRLGLYFQVPFRMKTVKPKMFAGRNYTVLHHTDTDVYLYTNNWMDGRLGDRTTRYERDRLDPELLEQPLRDLGMTRSNTSTTLGDYLSRNFMILLYRVSWKELLTFCPVTDTDYKSGLSKFYSKHGYMEVKEPESRLMEKDLGGVPY